MQVRCVTFLIGIEQFVMMPPLPPARRARPALVFALMLAPALASCAVQPSIRYPSLLPRAIESRSDAEPDIAIPVAVADPATDSVLADLRKTLDKTTAAFAPAAEAAERLASVAQGDKVGGERWIAAQTALANLDGYRATTSSALTDIDLLAISRAADGKPDYPAITSLHNAAQAAFEEQSARIAAIAERLPGA
jgi:hypothetical protein